MGNIKDIFKSRKTYDSSNPNFSFPEKDSLYTKYYIDTWNVTPFYGKVDTLGIPIVPKISQLRHCTYGTDPEQLLTLRPVLDFFFPLRQEYEKYYALNAFNKNSKFYKNKLVPKRAFINPTLDFLKILRSFYSNFIDYILGLNKINSIQNFDQFIDELLAYIKKENLYFTRAGYVESYDFSLLHTGLAIDIYGQDSNDDKVRKEYYDDVNGDSFLELCIRNNIKIDREIPWRIIADIRTKSSSELSFESVIKEYIPNFKGDLQLFFDNFYDRVIPYDENSYAYFEEFVVTLQTFYRRFIAAIPTYNLYLINQCGKANVITKPRQILNEDSITYDRAKYLNLYLQFRNAELSKVVPEEKLNHYTQNANQIFKSKTKGMQDKLVIIETIKYHTNNIGTLAYRYPSLYELDEKLNMP